MGYYEGRHSGPEPNFEADYRRSYGVHYFTAADSTPVTAVSFPTWEEFEGALRTLSPTTGYIMSPELITSPYPLSQISARRAEIEERVEVVRQISEQHPDATVLLGSANFDQAGLIRNSLIVIGHGVVQGYIDKRGVVWSDEASVFNRQREHWRAQASLASIGHGVVICSDIHAALSDIKFGSDSYWGLVVNGSTETLLVSSCWAVPKDPESRVSGDERYLVPLQKRVITPLFSLLPNIKEIIMVDRAIPGVSGVDPYNIHFKKI